MSKTNYPGIDYAAGQPVNRNTETGIRYGIIPSNQVNPDALEDIYSNGTDEDYKAWREEIESRIVDALKGVLSDDNICVAVDAVMEHCGDDYEGTDDCTRYSYESDGYKLAIDSSGDLWVFESPYVTYAQFCSPCAPGACYLLNPLEEPDSANKCYCLGPDWFDVDNPMPYVAHKL